MCIVGMNSEHILWCCHRSSLPLAKAIAEKLLMTFYDLVDMRRGHWS